MIPVFVLQHSIDPPDFVWQLKMNTSHTTAPPEGNILLQSRGKVPPPTLSHPVSGSLLEPASLGSYPASTQPRALGPAASSLGGWPSSSVTWSHPCFIGLFGELTESSRHSPRATARTKQARLKGFLLPFHLPFRKAQE